MVNMVADFFQIWTHLFLVTEGFLYLASQMICYFSGFCHVVHGFFNSKYAVLNFTYQILPVFGQLFVFFGGEYLFQTTKIF